MPDLAAAIARATLCPVRHHSPAAALATARALRQARPRLVLVEGACDGTDLIPLLLAPDTRLPVAILAYRPAAEGGEPRTVAAPFCDYSPELVALREAAALGAVARFCDAPAAFWLEERREQASAEPAGETLPDTTPADLFAYLAERCGFPSHDAFWDSRVEMAPVAAVGELIGAYGDMVAAWYGEREAERARDGARESWMLWEFTRALEEGLRPEEIVIVCGAAHARGLRAGQIDTAALARLRALPPARFALIPYSFPRLSEQLGYGAGNRAPAFYQAVWEGGGDWNAAASAFLLRLLNTMRARGYSPSLGDAIEAERLAVNLAGLRDKPAVGLEEVRDAAIACYGRGSAEPVALLNTLLIGDAVGAVSSLVAKTALQQEFLDQIARYGIPFADSPRDLRLNLALPAERAASVFLHRLGIADIPFARLAKTGEAKETEDPLARLLAAREKWEVRWTPSTDVHLIELAPLGNTLAEVCVRLLRRRLATGKNLGELSDALRDALLGRLEEVYGEVLAACERASSEDDDFPSLGRAAYLLDALVAYAEAATQREVLARLGERVFARASLLLPGAAAVADEEVARVGDGLRALHTVAGRRAGRGEETEVLTARLRRLAAGEAEAHATLAGLANAILYLDAQLGDADLAAALGLRLSQGEEPLQVAQFVEGLFSLNRAVLVRNRAIVGSLTDFLLTLSGERFVAVLALLRRALGGLNRHELAYLVETIAAFLGLEASAAQAATLDAGALDDLAALDKEMGDLF